MSGTMSLSSRPMPAVPSTKGRQQPPRQIELWMEPSLQQHMTMAHCHGAAAHAAGQGGVLNVHRVFL